MLAALLQAAQRGDARAYAKFLKEVTPRLRRMVQNERSFLQAADLEDLVQDVLLSLHAVRQTYDPQRPVMPWLTTIVRNRLADGARRYWRQSIHELLVDEMPVTFSDDGANREVDEYRDSRALRRAIRQLPPRQRTAIEMLKLREMSLKEAATATGSSIGALKVSVHRAMIALRKALTNA